jgi:hypothetical protein
MREDVANWGRNTTEVLFARKWRDGEKEQGLPPHEIVMTRTVTKDGETVEFYRERLTHPVDIRIANAQAEAGGVDIAHGRY